MSHYLESNNIMDTITSKAICIGYTKRDCNERPEYWVYDDNNLCKKISPMQWHKMPGVFDKTTAAAYELALRKELEKHNFGVKVDFNRFVRDHEITRAKERYELFKSGEWK